MLSPAGVLSNYSITYNTALFTIDPKAASVTPNAASKTYGAADPAFTGTLSGFLAADGVTAIVQPHGWRDSYRRTVHDQRHAESSGCAEQLQHHLQHGHVHD